MKLIDKLKNTPEWVLITLSIILIITSIIFGFNHSIKKFEAISESSLSYLKTAHNENIALTKKAPSESLTNEQVDILLKKILIVENHKSHHLHLIRRLSKNKYALLTLFPIMSAITAILVFLIIQRGWNSCSTYLKTYFILFTTLTSLIGLYPEVYKHTESISQHTKTYLEYQNLQKSIFNYSLIAPVVENDTIGFVRFLDDVNTQEKKLTNLIFDIEKRSLDKEIFNSVNGNR